MSSEPQRATREHVCSEQVYPGDNSRLLLCSGSNCYLSCHNFIVIFLKSFITVRTVSMRLISAHFKCIEHIVESRSADPELLTLLN